MPCRQADQMVGKLDQIIKKRMPVWLKMFWIKRNWRSLDSDDSKCDRAREFKSTTVFTSHTLGVDMSPSNKQSFIMSMG